MTFDEFTAEIGLLLTRMQNEPEDKHEIYLTLKERLNEMRAYGMPLPQDLVDMEKALEDEFSEDAAGESKSVLTSCRGCANRRPFGCKSRVPTVSQLRTERRLHSGPSAAVARISGTFHMSQRVIIRLHCNHC